jgi:hypothetical protein
MKFPSETKICIVYPEDYDEEAGKGYDEDPFGSGEL